MPIVAAPAAIDNPAFAWVFNRHADQDKANIPKVRPCPLSEPTLYNPIVTDFLPFCRISFKVAW
jgi:hypothetical protein